MTANPTVFRLPDRLAAKADPALIAADEAHFAEVRAHLGRSIRELSERLDLERRSPGGSGQEALERDLEIHRLTARLRTLQRYGVDLCLGRMVAEPEGEPIYIGRLGLTDRDGRRLLIDWRSPAAEPFFGATHAAPHGLASRRRYRWNRGVITDYWDEVFRSDGVESTAALDDQSAFIASLGGSRSARMRDVLGTIQSDQDAIIRAGSAGALVVDGGPGTGKTVVALHRAAYLLYADPRLAPGRGGVLFIGPSQGYLDYVDDVLPSLGEESVQNGTLRDLVAEGAAAGTESDPRAAALKASGVVVDAVEAAVVGYERPPASTLVVETPWADLELSPAEWAEAFDAVEPGTAHNPAREQVWEAVLELLAAQLDDAVGAEEVPPHQVRRALQQDEQLVGAFARAWPLLDPAGVVADLLSVPGYLSRCAPGLDAEAVLALQRADPRAWTVADLPALDAARRRIGDPEASRRARRRAVTLAAEQEEMSRVIEHLIAADDSELQLMSMLRGQDARNSLADDSAVPSTDPDQLAGPFAHLIVDEAQELTDAEWRMLLSRCPSRSLTIVGDRSQARHGFPESWQERLARVGITDVAHRSLTINYRTPEEVMAEAEPAIRAAIPDANVPTSVRSAGAPVVHAGIDQLESIVDGWLVAHPEGLACVIGLGSRASTARVRALTPKAAKGLEFDLVVLVDPDSFGDGIEGAVDRYVAMTRATQQLVVLSPADADRRARRDGQG